MRRFTQAFPTATTTGMSYRQYLAARIAQGMVEWGGPNAAREIVNLTDAIIAELSRTHENEHTVLAED